jgi:hypothetical protein
MNQTMVSPDTAEKKTSAPSKPLVRLLDRCDRCGSQAYHRATHSVNGQELLFCNHHGVAFKAALISQNFDLDDQSAPLFAVTKPDSSAAA